MEKWKTKHLDAIELFLHTLNTKSNKYVLKGGTSLLMCYGLDRFSEDIDLDGEDNDIKGIVEDFCEDNGYEYRLAKDTHTVNRYMIHYGGQKPLKIETSFRSGPVPQDATTEKNGIRVYTIDAICAQKTHAYMQRDRIRDLYDLCFICEHYYDDLAPATKAGLADAFSHKGVEQFDYLVKTQKDDLIKEDDLAENFLSALDKTGVLTSEEERNTVVNSGKTEVVRAHTNAGHSVHEYTRHPRRR